MLSFLHLGLLVMKKINSLSLKNRGALELLGSGRNPNFSEFLFLPELIKKAWPEPELCRFQRQTFLC